MALSLGIIFGLLAALGWGVADFLAKKAIDKIGIYKSLFFNQLFGMIPLIFYFYFFLKMPLLSLSTLSLLFVVGFLGVVVYLAIYKSFEIGPLSIASPIVAMWGMVTALLGIIFFGEILNLTQLVGISLSILGLVLASFKYSDVSKMKKVKIFSKGVYFAIIAMLGWGVTFALIKILVGDVGQYFPVIFMRLFAILFLLLYFPVAKLDFTIPKRNIIIILIAVGLFDAMAFLTYNYGISTEYVSIVSPLAALFPAITITLARIFLKEVLEINQKIGILSILTGLVLLSIV